MVRSRDEGRDTRVSELNTNVVFVVADPHEETGFSRLGEYPMVIPPRINETVTIQGGLGGTFGRFQVLEVIHNLPPAGRPETLNDVVCLIRPIFTAGDRERALSNLCKRDSHTGRGRVAK